MLGVRPPLSPALTASLSACSKSQFHFYRRRKWRMSTSGSSVSTTTSTSRESIVGEDRETKGNGAEEVDVVVQYVVLRRDLIDSWPLGSVVTQGCHASVAAIWEHKDDPHTLLYCNPPNLDSMHKVSLCLCRLLLLVLLNLTYYFIFKEFNSYQNFGSLLLLTCFVNRLAYSKPWEVSVVWLFLGVSMILWLLIWVNGFNHLIASLSILVRWNLTLLASYDLLLIEMWSRILDWNLKAQDWNAACWAKGHNLLINAFLFWCWCRLPLK